VTVGVKPRRLKLVDWKSALPLVNPAQSLPRTRSEARAQNFINPTAQSMMDTGLRRYDKCIFLLMAGDKSIP